MNTKIMLNKLEAALQEAQTGTPEVSVESAIAIYLQAKSEAERFNEIAAKAKALIEDVMIETGCTDFTTQAGKASVTAPSVSTRYDTRALDALYASNDAVRRWLEPHRSQQERPGTLRILPAK